LRPVGFTVPLAELFQDSAGALCGELARDFHRRVGVVAAAAQGPAERVGVGVRPLASVRIGLAVRPLTDLALSLLLLKLLRQPLRALAHGVERAALPADGVVGVAVAKLALGIAHGLAGVAALVHTED